ncbi:MAG: hypothetical protein ABJF01_16110 [bacterium]
MTGAPGFLEFFILEASEYVEQLDGLLLGGSSNGPDAGAMQRVARALRGTATMAKLASFADVAGGVERVARAMHEGTLRWDPTLGGALVAAIDDLKMLLHSARTWSPADDHRAAGRAAELARFAPLRPAPTPEARGPIASGRNDSPFLATEAANIAAGLELLTTRPGDRDTAANVLRRVRALRGVAGVKEVGPLADVLQATEDAARGFEAAHEPMSPQSRQLLETAAAYLRTLSAALRGEAIVDAPSAARDAFAAAHTAWQLGAGERELVVPIADLFYGDGIAGLVEASPNPPTSAQERFRLELVSLGEHLRQVVDGARKAKDGASVDRSRRELRHTLRALQSDAESFAEHDVARFIAGHVEATEHLDFLGLAALEDLASVLAQPGAQGERLTARLTEIAGGRVLTSAIGAGFGESEPVQADVLPAVAPEEARRPLTPQRAATPQRAGTPPRSLAFVPANTPISVARPAAPPSSRPPRSPVPTPPAPVEVDSLDSASAALIDSTIAALDHFTSHPFSDPTPIPEDIVVSIESLLYRGRAALDRAVEIRDQLRDVGLTSDTPALEELFDLLELAQAE